jgi:DNA-binding transcriptional LysR family regulator
MNLTDQMETFVRVVEGGSLSGAARRLGLSLAAVSRQLAALEDDLGTRLVLRSTRRLQVTPSGQRWYQHCVRLLRELEDARADVADAREPRGAVVVSASITIGSWHVVPRLERLARRHPHLSIDLRLEDHVVDLVGDAVDVAVRGGIAAPDSASIVARQLLEFRRVLVAAPSYLKRHGTPRHPRDLERHDAVLQPSPFAAWELSRDGETVTVVPRARLRSRTPAALRDWALAGAGVALLPEWLVEAGPRGLKRLLPGWTTPPIRAWALHRVEQRGSARIRAVVDALSC